MNRLRSFLFTEAGDPPDGGGAAAPWHSAIWSDKPGAFKEGWQTALPDEFEPHRAELANYPDFPTLVKALADNKAAARAKAAGLVPPGPDATDEQKQAFEAQLRKLRGVPEAADPALYELDKLPEGVQYDEESAKAFAAEAHKLGLDKSQAKGLQSFYLTMIQQQEAAQAAAFKQAAEKEQQELQETFGTKLGATVTQAQRAALALGLPADVFDPSSKNFMAISAKDILRIASVYAEAAGETRLPAAGAVKNLDARTQATDIMTNPSNPFYARFHAGDQEVSKMVDGLLAKATGRAA